MDKWQWKSEYSVHHPIMDAHHQQIFSIIKKMHDILLYQNDQDMFESYLLELKDYANYHFTEEEALLESINYEGLIKQKAQHQIYRNKIEELILLYRSDKKLIELKTMSFLKEWIIKHILEFDLQYAHLI